MKKPRIIAEVFAGEPPPAPIKYEVTNGRTVTLRFPNAIRNVYPLSDYRAGYRDFTRKLRPQEAREIGQALLDPAAEVDAATDDAE